MARKLTYEELERTAKELEREVVKRKQAEKALKQTNEFLRNILDSSSSISIVSTDVEQNILFWNRGAEKIFGYKAEEIVGRQTVTMLYPDDEVKGEINEIRSSIFENKKEITTKLREVAKDGRIVWIRLNLTPRFDEKGNVIGILGIGEDITERKRAEEVLQESEEKYRSLVESTEDPIYLVDENCTYLFMNRKYIARLGLPLDEAVGRPYSRFHSKKETAEFAKTVRKVFETGKSLSYEYRSERDDKYFIRTLSPVKDPDGRTTALTVVSKDITERKQAEEAIKERERELEDKAKNLEELNTALKVLLKRREEDKTELEEKVLSNVKELVEPYLEKLKKTGLTRRQQTYIDILESNLNDIVSPFLRRLSSEYLNLTPTEIQVADLVRQGKTTKEIAELLNSSPRAIEFHRENLREKLGLKNKKANLRSHLLSLP